MLRDRTVNQAAEYLGIPVGTVKSRVYYALRALRVCWRGGDLMSSQIEHTDVGAYALGLLEDGDRRAFEAHLHGCGRCQAELGELSGTAGALFELAPGSAEEPDEPSAPRLR